MITILEVKKGVVDVIAALLFHGIKIETSLTLAEMYGTYKYYIYIFHPMEGTDAHKFLQQEINNKNISIKKQINL